MATTQVAEAEKNLHKHMTEKNRGGKAEDGRLTQRCVECRNTTTNTQQSGHGSLTADT